MKRASTILQELEELQTEKKEVLGTLLRAEELAVGTLRREKRRCGNPNCHCAKEPSHEQVIFYFTKDGGRRTSTFVRRDEEKRFENAAQCYKEFREAVRKLKHLNSEELRLLGVLKASRALDPISRKS